MPVHIFPSVQQNNVAADANTANLLILYQAGQDINITIYQRSRFTVNMLYAATLKSVFRLRLRPCIIMADNDEWWGRSGVAHWLPT
jgi:hypothetical protein